MAIFLFGSITTAFVIILYADIDDFIKEGVLTNIVQFIIAIFGTIFYIVLHSKIRKYGKEWFQKAVNSIKLQFLSMIVAFLISSTFRIISALKPNTDEYG